MNDCEELKQELDDLNSWYYVELVWCGAKALLSLFGLDWVIDLIRGRKSFKEAFGLLEAFLLVLLSLDVYLVIQWIRKSLPALLEKLPLGEALKETAKKFLGPLAVVLLLINIGFAIKGFIECRRLALEVFSSRAAEIYNNLECPDKDRIFREKGVPIPNMP